MSITAMILIAIGAFVVIIGSMLTFGATSKEILEDKEKEEAGI